MLEGQVDAGDVIVEETSRNEWFLCFSGFRGLVVNDGILDTSVLLLMVIELEHSRSYQNILVSVSHEEVSSQHALGNLIEDIGCFIAVQKISFIYSIDFERADYVLKRVHRRFGLITLQR